ncbi:MAG: isoaspartyl peptidase/L-asparaginase [Phycisphaerales bacterium]|nr:isoaspartyl peptidase/L-asparaginase [Phycisphaerales bacterium]
MKNTTTADTTGPCEGWAIAIHGGAGTISRNGSPSRRDAAAKGLRTALELGRDMLQEGEDALDVVEAVVKVLEDDPNFNAGKGAVFTAEGTHELDASIMDGATRNTGAVAAVRTVRNPIVLARLVMTETPHVLIAADGAETFADEVDVQRVPNEYFDTEHRRAALDRVLEGRKASDDSPERPQPRGGSTVGCVVVDARGRLAAATSTGGMTAKRWGRVGDSPIVGAGTWADARVAVSGTGTGEEFIRWGVAQDVAALVEYRGLSLADAATEVVDGKLRPGDGGVICVDHEGGIAMVFNSTGMYRGAANAKGLFKVAIWDEPVTAPE